MPAPKPLHLLMVIALMILGMGLTSSPASATHCAEPPADPGPVWEAVPDGVWNAIPDKQENGLKGAAGGICGPEPKDCDYEPLTPYVTNGVKEQGFNIEPVDVSTLLPTVVFVHGGGWIAGCWTWRYPASDDEHGIRLKQELEELLAEGFRVVSVEYRKSSDHPWQDQVADIQRAVAFLQDNASTYGIVADKMALYGHSAGAHLALLAAMTGSGPSGSGGRVNAVVSWAGPTDMIELVTRQGCALQPCLPWQMGTANQQFSGWLVQRWEGNCTLAGCYDPGPCSLFGCASWLDATPVRRSLLTLDPAACGENPVASCIHRFRQTSPIVQVSPGDPAAFIGQGVADPVVPVEQALEMAAILRANQVPYKLKLADVYRCTRDGAGPVLHSGGIPDYVRRLIRNFLYQKLATGHPQEDGPDPTYCLPEI